LLPDGKSVQGVDKEGQQGRPLDDARHGAVLSHAHPALHLPPAQGDQLLSRTGDDGVVAMMRLFI